MACDRTSWRKRLKAVPELKKWNCDQSTAVLTRSALRGLLFNNGKPKGHFIKDK